MKVKYYNIIGTVERPNKYSWMPTARKTYQETLMVFKVPHKEVEGWGSGRMFMETYGVEPTQVMFFPYIEGEGLFNPKPDRSPITDRKVKRFPPLRKDTISGGSKKSKLESAKI